LSAPGVAALPWGRVFAAAAVVRCLEELAFGGGPRVLGGLADVQSQPRLTEGENMSIQLAPNTPGPRMAPQSAAVKPASSTPPRVLQSARAPHQLSFFFKRG